MIETLGNIASMPKGPQREILGLLCYGHWDFKENPLTPVAGSVLLWTKKPTHSAIVTGLGIISGYNQACIWLDAGFEYSQKQAKELPKSWSRVGVILEETIVQAAAKFDL